MEKPGELGTPEQLAAEEGARPKRKPDHLSQAVLWEHAVIVDPDLRIP